MGDILSLIIVLVPVIAAIAGMWAVFEKAGYDGWLSIIPILQFFVLARVSGNPWWIVLLVFVPFVGILVFPYIFYSLAQRFGQGILFTLGLLFLGFIFFPVLGFGDYRYQPK